MQTSYNWHAAEAVSWQTVQKASSMRLSPCGLPKPLQNALHQLCCLQHDPQQRSRLLVHQKFNMGKCPTHLLQDALAATKNVVREISGYATIGPMMGVHSQFCHNNGPLLMQAWAKDHHLQILCYIRW